MARRKATDRNTGDQLTASAAALAAAMAAIEAAAPSRTRPIEWTPESDAVIRAGYAKQLSRRDLVRIVSRLLGRPISHEPVQRRAAALGL